MPKRDVSIIVLILLLAYPSSVVASYLGCFRISKVPGLKVTAVATPAACRSMCTKFRVPLYGFKSKKCYCGTMVPPRSAQLQDSGCQSSAADTLKLNFEYEADKAGKLRCHIEEIPLTAANTEIPWGSERVIFNGSTMTMPLINGYDGARVISKRGAVYYGMISLMASIPGVDRPVTAFYLSTDTGVRTRNDWQELDLEWINGYKWPNVTSGSFWTNMFYNGKPQVGRALIPSQLRKRVGSGFAIPNRFHTYSLNWQKSYVDWHINGKWVDSRLAKDGLQIPDKPMYMMFSIWSMAGNCRYFGGCGPINRRYKASFTQLRRIGCK